MASGALEESRGYGVKLEREPDVVKFKFGKELVHTFRIYHNCYCPYYFQP